MVWMVLVVRREKECLNMCENSLFPVLKRNGDFSCCVCFSFSISGNEYGAMNVTVKSLEGN